MGCGCDGTPSNYTATWEHRRAGKSPVPFSSQAEAEKAKAEAGGKGFVIKVLRRARSN